MRGAAVLLVLAGCSSVRVTNRTPGDYEPTTSVVYLQRAPNRPYKRIATLVAPRHGVDMDAVEYQARRLGGDVVVRAGTLETGGTIGVGVGGGVVLGVSADEQYFYVLRYDAAGSTGPIELNAGPQ